MGIGGTLDVRIFKETKEIERHLHNREKWFGDAAVAVGETHVADRMVGGIAAFALLSDNDDFGSWVQLIGSDDTPVSAGMIIFDGHRFMVVDTDSTAAFIIQVAAGESADLAASIAAEEFTEVPYISQSNQNDSGISDIMSLRIPVGSKIWGRCACIGQDAKTINVYFGIHEYEE